MFDILGEVYQDIKAHISVGNKANLALSFKTKRRRPQVMQEK